MGDKLIDHINKYTDSNSILVHTERKGLVRLYCPFVVRVIQKVDNYTVGDELEVVKVKVSRQLDLVYVINDKGYYHYYFSIQV